MSGLTVLQRLAAGETVFTLGIRNARTPDIVRMASTAGCAAVWIDLEHSSMPIDCATQMAAFASALGVDCWVRIPERDYGVIGRLLDGAAGGIVAPRIETAAEAREVVQACRFPPRGRRSQITQLPQFGFARMPAAELNHAADRGTVVQILIESQRGVENAEEIASLDGVDILGVGLNDLSADLGCLGDYDNERMRQACRQVAHAAVKYKKIAVAGGVPNGASYARLIADGYSRLIFAAIDTDVLASGVTQRVSEWSKQLASNAPA